MVLQRLMEVGKESTVREMLAKASLLREQRIRFWTMTTPLSSLNGYKDVVWETHKLILLFPSVAAVSNYVSGAATSSHNSECSSLKYLKSCLGNAVLERL